MEGTLLVAITLFGWPFVLASLYLMLPAQRAAIVAFLFAWLFLPIAEYEFQGIPEYNKMTATCLGAFLATLMFDPTRLVSYRPRWVDLSCLILCFCPVASSLTNGLGLYDGLSESLRVIIQWGFPYFLGRIYFNDLRGMRELAIGVFIGGIIYVPLCWIELRFSPQLHRIVYGYHQHGFVQTIRYGGYRPMVFLEHGLMVGMWMTTASLAGVALWATGSLRSFRGVPVSVLVGLVVITAVLCKSTAAALLLVIGLGVMAATRYLRNALPLIALTSVYVVYVALRVSGAWSGWELVDATTNVFGPDRGASIEVRVTNENALVGRASQRALFGWGGWGRSRITDAMGNDISITDSQWVIRYGVNGLLGLAAAAATVIIPIFLVPWRIPPRLWFHPMVVAVPTLALVLALWMIDNAVNNMFNPIYVLIAGGLAGQGAVTENLLTFSRRQGGSGDPDRTRTRIPGGRTRTRIR
ncbi:MAG: hypothetical protein AMXMBFR82_04670 [Candidatus Hydrogenedentota bacterium]